MTQWNGEKFYAKYTAFRVQSLNAYYKLNIDEYEGDAGQ